MKIPEQDDFDFDKNFNEVQKQVNTVFMVGLVGTIAMLLLGLAVLGGLGYVAWYFLVKVW